MPLMTCKVEIVPPDRYNHPSVRQHQNADPRVLVV